jgi:hypothetical protein
VLLKVDLIARIPAFGNVTCSEDSDFEVNPRIKG